MKIFRLAMITIKEYKAYNIIVGIQLFFCVILMSYVLTNVQKYTRYEKFYHAISPEHDWCISDYGTQKAEEEYSAISNIFSGKEIGMLAKGYAGKNSCYFINAPMKNYYQPELSSGNWFSQEQSDYYEAVISESLSQDYTLNKIYSLNLFDEETQKTFQISVKIIGILDPKCLIWKLGANYFEGMFEEQFDGFLINLEDAHDSDLMGILDLMGFIIKNNTQQEPDKQLEATANHHIYAMHTLYEQYENEVKTDKGIAEMFLVLVMLLTLTGSNSLLLLLADKKKQKYALYMQSGATPGKCICTEFLYTGFLLLGVLICFCILQILLHHVIETGFYFSLSNTVLSFFICGSTYMISYSFVLGSLWKKNLKTIFSFNGG